MRVHGRMPWYALLMYPSAASLSNNGYTQLSGGTAGDPIFFGLRG